MLRGLAQNLHTAPKTQPHKTLPLFKYQRRCRTFTISNCAPNVCPDIDEEKFRQETRDLIMRSLTGQATKKVLQQLHEMDLYAAQWLNNFCADHSPLKGDEFIEELMAQRNSMKQDKFNNKNHFISPIDLAHRVLITRADLAQYVGEKVEFVTNQKTVELQRKYLESKYSKQVQDIGGRKQKGDVKVLNRGGEQAGEEWQ